MALFDEFFEQLAEHLGGASVDQIKVIFVLVSSYPAALGLRFIRNPEFRHLYNISLSLFIFLGIFDLLDAVRILCVNSLVVYLILLYIKNHWGPRLVFIFLMAHMSMSHIYRQLYAISITQYDATGPEMVIVIKLTSFAYCIYDGLKLNLKEVEQEFDEQASESSIWSRQKAITNRIIEESIDIAQYTPRQLKKAVPANKFPSLLEYFGFIFYFPSILVGPAIEFEDYRQWATSSGEFETVPNDYGFKQALSKLWFGLFLIAMSFAFGGRYQIPWTLSDEYKKLSLIDRIWFVQMACSCARFRFYIVWLMSEGSMILSGLGYNGNDGRGNIKYDRVVNIDVFAYETADNPRSLIQAWNCQTDKWLKNYVYLRLCPPGQRPTFYTTLITFAICAIWHGFYPGYYFTFISAALLVTCHRTLRRNARPIFLTSPYSSFKFCYDLLGWLFSQSIVNYICLPFILLNVPDCLYVWKLNAFYGHLTMILVFSFFFVFNGTKFCKWIITNESDNDEKVDAADELLVDDDKEETKKVQ